jgi:hypothetical protein
MTPPEEPPAQDRSAKLEAELERVRRQEAVFRARAVQESLEHRKTIKLQTAELKEIHKRSAERDTYVHQLHLAREADKRELRQAYADLEAFVFRLRDAEDASAALRRTIESMRRSWGWRVAAPFRALRPETPAAETVPDHHDVPGARFTYFLRTSPFRIYRGPTFTLLGWAFPEDGRAVLEVRARVDGREYPGTCGLEEPEVIAEFGDQPGNPRPGFRLPFETPPGRHHLSLEARVEGAGWVSFLTTPIWVDHASPAPSEPAAGA